jgi:hypothetical protein
VAFRRAAAYDVLHPTPDESRRQATMGTSGERREVAPAPAAVPGCPLTPAEQTRNIALYAANIGLVYLASPVTYVGLVHGGLLNRLGFSDTIANLPASVYLWTTPLPVLVAWYFPQVRLLKTLLVVSFLAIAVMGALVAQAVVFLGPNLVLAALVAHAAVLGCALGVVATCQWEMIGRGVAESRRGQALGLAFGFGPVLAVAASFASQLVLAGKMEVPGLSLEVPAIPFPWNFASLFAASLPVMALAAFLSGRYVIRLPVAEAPRETFARGVLGGFGRYFGTRLILITAIAYVLVYSGNMIQQNVSLYTPLLLGGEAKDYVGLQNMLRFGFKIVAGFVLGWLLIRTNPKTLLAATAALTFSGVAWALAVPGRGVLVSFGILGAGELFGVYYLNYILGCSPPSQFRRNMAFTSLVTLPVGLAGVLYGFLSDTYGVQDRVLGFQVSFAVALLLLAAAIVLVLAALPARPRPEEPEPQPKEPPAVPAPDQSTGIKEAGKMFSPGEAQ